MNTTENTSEKTTNGRARDRRGKIEGSGRLARPAARAAIVGVLLAVTGAPSIARPQGDGPMAEGPPTSAQSLYLDLDSRLWVEGTSTVRDWTCEAGVVAGTLRPNPVEAPLAMSALDEAIRTGSVQIPGLQLDCSNDTMNEHMRDALKLEDHPDIRFEFDEYRVMDQGGDTATLELPGRLTIAGVTHPHTVTARAMPEADGALRVTGSSEFPMTAFEVEPPSLMFGLMKVGDEVAVHFDLVVRHQEQETGD